MEHYTPTLAWLQSAAPNSPPTLAFVLSWEQRPDRRGHLSWWALVAVPRGGGVLPPSMEIRWEWEVRLRPAVVEPPK